MKNKGGILYSDDTGGAINKYKENLYDCIKNTEKNWNGDNYRFAKDEHLLDDIKEAQKDTIGSLNIGEKITYGFSNTVKSLGENSSIKEMAKAINVSPDIIATSGIVSLITASVIGAGFIGKKIANSIFKIKKREEMIRKFGEAQVVKQEEALKAQQASVYMGTELPQSVQIEALNER